MTTSAVVTGAARLRQGDRAAARRARAPRRDHRRRRGRRRRHRNRAGRVAVWVNNAGVARAGKVWAQSDDDVTLMVEANRLGVVHGSRVAVDAMRDGGGHLSFTTSLQGELDQERITVRAHALCPHAAATDLVAGAHRAVAARAVGGAVTRPPRWVARQDPHRGSRPAATAAARPS